MRAGPSMPARRRGGLAVGRPGEGLAMRVGCVWVDMHGAKCLVQPATPQAPWQTSAPFPSLSKGST